MSEFINEFGKENFIIIVAVVVAIVLALVIIVLIEKVQAKKARKKQIEKEISNYNKINAQVRKPVIEKEEVVEKESSPVYEKLDELYEEEFPEEKDSYDIEHSSVKEEIREKKTDDVFYVENVNPREEAKEKLEEVTKKLIEDSELIEHTHFETEQEEKSIISYEELVSASHDIDEKNDKLLEDEGEAAITLEELYQKHVDTQNEIEDEVPEVKVNNPIFEDNGERKFKNSEIISPVFGVYSGKSKPTPISNKMEPVEILEQLDDAIGMKDLEAEIEKTEEFLSELKRLKNKLD